MNRMPRRCLLLLVLGWAALRCAPLLPSQQTDAAPPAPLPPVVARYEQMLAASPAKGTAFDKVYQHFFEGPGLDALAARWQARATSGGPGAETFPLLIGLLAERRAHPDDARTAYQQYNAAYPDDPRGWTALGELESSEGRFGPAADALAHALAPGAKPPVPVSTRPTLYRELARAQARSFLVAASLGTWRKLAAEFPDDPGILQEVGEALQEAQAFDEARGTFEIVRELARKNNDAFGRINADLRMGQVEEARGHAAEAVKIYEGVVAEAKTGSWLEREARARIEQLYRGQEDLPGLADYYKKWLEDHPRDTTVATRRAAVLLELNRRAEAIDLLQQAVAWAPERQELQVELARRLGDADRPAEMAAAMEKLTGVAPEEKSYWQLLGDARWQLLASLPATANAADKDKLKADALAAWNHLSPADGKDPAATGQLADLLASHHLKDEALAQYARAAALAPDLPDTYERWAGFLAQIDRKDEARRVVAGIVNARPANANAANDLRLAAALDRLDDSVGALAATEQGLALEPRNFDLLSQRWQLLAATKRWAEAAALYPRLLAAAPNPFFAEQVQGRQVIALQAAGQLADARTALAARLPTLDENDLALLVRSNFQAAGDDPDALTQARQALAAGRARFPRAAPFARLEGELAKRTRDVDGQVAALRRLIDLQPAQKTDALTEIARILRDAGQPDDAVAAARELVAASPASAAAQGLLADLLLQAGHDDEGVASLRDAVRLSDKPNDVRLRLARVLADLGRNADARRTLDEAFEAAADAHERLAITRPLTEAYQRDNRLDELITRFQTLQQGEAEGWRYALYLAEIYQQTKDYGAARRELAQALATRPHDGALLRQLVRVAEAEDNPAEAARYQALLAEAEPSDQNRFALVTALLANNQPEAGFNALRAYLPVILKTPGAWDTLLPLLARNDLTTKAGELLAAELGGERADLKARFTVALFQAVAGNVEQARAAFWSVFDTKTGSPSPPSPPAPAATGGNAPTDLMAVVYGGDSIPEQRYRAGELTRRTAQTLLSPGGYAGFGRGRGVFTAVPALPSGLPNAPSVTDTTRDAALLYLAALAVQDHTATEFLAELDRHLAARESSRADRLVACSLMEDVDSQTREITAQVDHPEPGLDGLALARTALLAFNNDPQNRRHSETPPLTVAQTAALAPLFDPLLARVIRANPTLETGEADAMRYAFLLGVGQQGRAETVRRDFLARTGAHSSLGQIRAALNLLTQGDFSPADRALLQTLVPAFTLAAARSPHAISTDEYAYYPALVFQEDTEAAKLPPAEFADLAASLLPIWYPLAPPVATTPARAGNAQGQGEDALPPSRFFDQNTFEAIQSVAQSLHQGDPVRRSGVLARVDQQAKDLPPTRRIFPQLVAVYFESVSGDPAAALARAQALLATAPDDPDLRLLTGVLLGRADRHVEAAALLDTVDATRTGETPFDLQSRVLAEAKAAGDTDLAKRVAGRLAAMRVPPEARESLGQELRELGLTEQADALAKPTASARPSSSGQPHSIFDSETSQRLQKFVQDKNEDGALSLARDVLAALPPPAASAPGRGSNADYVLRAALRVIKDAKKIDTFIADAEKQLVKDPGSLSLNYQLAVLYQEADKPDTPSTTVAGPNRAAVYWSKLAELRPKETRYQRLLAHSLAERGLRDEAVTIYDRLLDQSPDEAFADYNEIRFIYTGSRIVPLAKRLLSWKPTPSANPGMGRGNASITLFQTARECAAQKQADLVVALCRHGIERDAALGAGGNLGMGVHDLLISALLDQNRLDEARQVFIGFFLPPVEDGKSAATDNATQLGFPSPVSARSNRRSWMANLLWSHGSVDISSLSALENPRTAGLLPDLSAALLARRAADPEGFVREDLDWLLTVVRLDLHDPTLLLDLPAILNANPGGKTSPARSVNEQTEIAVRLAIAQRLLRWPGHAALALEAYSSARKMVSTAWRGANAAIVGNLAASIGIQQARVELALDDARSALGTLRAVASEVTNANLAAQADSSQELSACLAMLLQAGPEADPVYLDLFDRATKMPGFRKDGKGAVAFGFEKNIRLGDNPRFQAFAWLLDDPGGGGAGSPDTTLVYELRPENPSDKSGLLTAPDSRARSFPGSEGARTLTFSYGDNPEHFAAIGRLQTDRTFGTWTGPVLRGSGLLKVTIEMPRPRDAPGTGDCWLRVVRTPNLLTNPQFDGLASRDPNAAVFSLPGWKGLPAGMWTLSHGENPLPGRAYVHGDTFLDESHLVTGTRIPLEAGQAYFQSGWVRQGIGTVRIGRRYLDADGKELKTSECPEIETLNWGWQSQRLQPSAGGLADDAIPPGTVFIEPFLRVEGGGDWTGLFLGKVN